MFLVGQFTFPVSVSFKKLFFYLADRKSFVLRVLSYKILSLFLVSQFTFPGSGLTKMGKLQNHAFFGLCYLFNFQTPPEIQGSLLNEQNVKFFITGFGFAWVGPTSRRLFLTRRHQAGASAVLLLLLRPRILKEKGTEREFVDSPYL